MSKNEGHHAKVPNCLPGDLEHLGVNKRPVPHRPLSDSVGRNPMSKKVAVIYLLLALVMLFGALSTLQKGRKEIKLLKAHEQLYHYAPNK
jgi:hypothetical protein